MIAKHHISRISREDPHGTHPIYANSGGPIQIRSAQMGEAAAISRVLLANWNDRGLFQESPARISRNIGNFLVAESETGCIVGCAGVHLERHSLGRIYSVAVVPQCQGHGVGRKLIAAAVRSATLLDVERLWLVTSKPSFFSRYGFKPISRWELPSSVLLRQLRKTLRQPIARILPALFGRHTFMQRNLRSFPEIAE